MSCTLKVGYARACITPRESVPLAGYGNDLARMSAAVLDDLYAICIAFTDGENNTVLLFENDLIGSDAKVFGPIRRAIADAVGLTSDRVMVGATHTHSAPSIMTDTPSIARYLAYLREQMIACAKAAMADRKPTAISVADTKTKDLSFVRHYVLEDGSYMGVNLNILRKSPIARHVSEPDPLMRIVRFTREGGEDVLLVNWQCHPHRTGFGKSDISADIVGVFRSRVERVLGCKCIYFTGAAGNVNPLSFDTKENRYADYVAQGTALAEYAIAAKNFVPVAGGRVQILGETRREPFNAPDDTVDLAAARDVAEFFEKNGEYRPSLAYAESKGFHSQYQAMMLLKRHRMAQEGVKEIEVPMYAVSVGDLAFVAAPYEMFDINGRYIRDFSPFPATIVVTCSNDTVSYVPAAYGYRNACYEADSAILTAGAGERLAEGYVELLEKLYTTRLDRTKGETK